MKTQYLIIILCILLFASANTANSQKVTGITSVHWEFTPERIPCLTEVISGDVPEAQIFTRNTYHVQADGVLYGKRTNEEYTISYVYNQVGPVGEDGKPVYGESFHFVLPILLKHDGKLVAKIHYGVRFIYNANGIEVQDILIDKVNCK